MACGPDFPSAGESASDMFSAIYNYYPGLSQVFRQEMLPTAQEELKTAQAVSPGFQQLITDLYKQFGPENAKIGADVDRISRLEAGKTDAELLNTSGRELAKTYREIDEGLNPEYYKTRATASGKLDELLGSINLNDPNPEAERLINQENARTGNLTGPTSSTNTLANALSFGEAANGRRASLTNAINAASNFLQPASSASAFNPATTALQRPTSNTGASNFAGANTSAGQSSVASGQNMLNQMSSIQQGYNTNMANRRDTIDRINEGFSSL